MKQIIIILLAFLSLSELHSQNDEGRIKVQISSRVDTNKVNIKDIINLYENYLNSIPDSIYNNPYWNRQEKKQYKDFDFSRRSMYQSGMNAELLSSIFTPFIMSVEPIGEKYQIRVMFSSLETDPQYVGSKVWCIQKLNAIKENGVWALENLIVELSKKWVTKSYGQVIYIFPPTHNFDIEQAKLSEKFCNDIIRRFNPNYQDSFKYYVTKSVDDMGLLENFDYYFIGITTGKTLENMILTARGEEYFPHEFVHMLLPKNQNRGPVIEEGLAEYLGTKNNADEYNGLLSKLGNDLINNKVEINFKSVISQEVRFNGYQTAYPAGAALCEIIYNKSGDKGLLDLVQGNTSDYESTLSLVMKITGLTYDEVVFEWEKFLKEATKL